MCLSFSVLGLFCVSLYGTLYLTFKRGGYIGPPGAAMSGSTHAAGGGQARVHCGFIISPAGTQANLLKCSSDPSILCSPSFLGRPTRLSVCGLGAGPRGWFRACSRLASH